MVRLLLLSTALIVGFSWSVEAGAWCAPRETALRNLEDKFSETPTYVAITGVGALLEVLTSDDGGATWTIVVTSPSGLTCLFAAGEHFRPAPERPAGEPL